MDNLIRLSIEKKNIEDAKITKYLSQNNENILVVSSTGDRDRAGNPLACSIRIAFGHYLIYLYGNAAKTKFDFMAVEVRTSTKQKTYSPNSATAIRVFNLFLSTIE